MALGLRIDEAAGDLLLVGRQVAQGPMCKRRQRRLPRPRDDLAHKADLRVGGRKVAAQQEVINGKKPPARHVQAPVVRAEMAQIASARGRGEDR